MNNFFSKRCNIYIFFYRGFSFTTIHESQDCRRRRTVFLYFLTTTSSRFTNTLAGREPLVSKLKSLTTNLCALKIEYLTWNNMDIFSSLLKSYCRHCWNGFKWNNVRNNKIWYARHKICHFWGLVWCIKRGIEQAIC